MHGDKFLSVSAGNNCILFNEQGGAVVVAVIRNFVKTSDGMQVVVQRFQEMESFNSYPLESSRLGIFKVHTYSPTLETLSAQFVQNARKCILAELDATSCVSPPTSRPLCSHTTNVSCSDFPSLHLRILHMVFFCVSMFRVVSFHDATEVAVISDRWW